MAALTTFSAAAGQDSPAPEFRFAREWLNPPLSDTLFKFQAPAGVEVL